MGIYVISAVRCQKRNAQTMTLSPWICPSVRRWLFFAVCFTCPNKIDLMSRF